MDAAKLGCKIFYGPYVYNFQEVYELLKSYDIAEETNNEIELAKAVIKNFDFPIKIDQQKINLLNSYGKKILTETAKEVNKYLQ